MLLIVFGLPGSGKSYFSQELSKKLKADYLSSDELRLEIQKKGQYSELDKSQVYELMMKRMTESLSKGRTVVLDATFSRRKMRIDFINQSENLNSDYFLIRIEANESDIKERLEKSRPYSEADYSVYKKIKEEFEEVNRPHLILNSSKLELEEMLLRALNYIGKSED